MILVLFQHQIDGIQHHWRPYTIWNPYISSNQNNINLNSEVSQTAILIEQNIMIWLKKKSITWNFII